MHICMLEYVLPVFDKPVLPVNWLNVHRRINFLIDSYLSGLVVDKRCLSLLGVLRKILLVKIFTGIKMQIVL